MKNQLKRIIGTHTILDVYDFEEFQKLKINKFEVELGYDTTTKYFYDDVDMIGYVPFPMSNFQFIDNPEWVDNIFTAIKNTYKIDMYKFIKSISIRNPN